MAKKLKVFLNYSKIIQYQLFLLNKIKIYFVPISTMKNVPNRMLMECF